MITRIRHPVDYGGVSSESGFSAFRDFQDASLGGDGRRPDVAARIRVRGVPSPSGKGLGEGVPHRHSRVSGQGNRVLPFSRPSHRHCYENSLRKGHSLSLRERVRVRAYPTRHSRESGQGNRVLPSRRPSHRHSRESGNLRRFRIQSILRIRGFWIPAFAGMTEEGGNDGGGRE